MNLLKTVVSGALGFATGGWVGAAAGVAGSLGSDGKPVSGVDPSQVSLNQQQEKILKEWWEGVGKAEMETAKEYQTDIAPVLQEGFKNWLIGKPQAAAVFASGNNAAAKSPVVQAATAATKPATQTAAATSTTAAPASNFAAMKAKYPMAFFAFNTEDAFKKALADVNANPKAPYALQINQIKQLAATYPEVQQTVAAASGTPTTPTQRAGTQTGQNPITGTGTLPAGTQTPVFDPTQHGIGVTQPTPDIKDYNPDWAGIPKVANRVGELAVTPGWESVGKQYADTINNRKLMGLETGLRSLATAEGAAMARRGLGGLTPTQQQALLNSANRERVALEADTLDARLQQEAALRGEQNASVNQKTLLDQTQQDNWYNRLRTEQGLQGQNNSNALQRAGWTDQQNAEKKADFWNVQGFLSGQGTPTNAGAAVSGMGQLAGQYGQQQQIAFNQNQQNQSGTETAVGGLSKLANYWLDQQAAKKKQQPTQTGGGTRSLGNYSNSSGLYWAG